MTPSGGNTMIGRMRISRRDLITGLGAAPLVVRAQSDRLRARVKIDTERVIGDIDPMIYGNFIEHLGRCIDGGVFEEKSPLSDANGFRRDVLEAARKLNVSNSAGPAETSPRTITGWTGSVRATSGRHGSRWHGARWRAIVSARTSFWIMWRRWERSRTSAANFGTGTWSGGPAVGGVLQLSRRHGDDPSAQAERPRRALENHVWGLGNEMDGPWQMGHRSAEDYGKFALEGAKLMKWTDPSIKLIAAGSSNLSRRVPTGWLEPHGAAVSQAPRRLSLASPVRRQSRANDYDEFVASGWNSISRTKTAEGIIDAALSGDRGTARSTSPGTNGTSGIGRAAQAQRGRRILEEHYNLEDALVVATFLNSFVNHAHIVKMANHGATGERHRADFHQ